MPDLRTERTAAGGGFVLMLRFVVTSALNYGFGVALVWLLPRSEFGAVSVLQNVLLLSGMVLVAGMPWVLARKIAQADAEAADATTGDAWHGTFRSAVAVNLGVAAVLMSVLLVLQATPLHVLPDASFAVVGAVALTIVLLSTNAVLGGGLHGSRRFDALGAMQTSEIATKVVVGLTFVVVFDLGTGAVALGFLAGAVVATGCSWWGLRDRIPGWGPFADRATARLALPTGAGTGSVALLVTLDVLVLSALGRGYGIGITAVAVYQVAAILARIPYYLGNALGDAVFPYIASGRTRQEGHAWFAAAFRWVMLGLVPIQLVLLIIPAAPLRVLFPGGYAEAAGLIQIMTVGTFALLTADLLVKAMYARGLATTVARRTPVAVVVQFIGLLVLVPRWGTTGAAVAFALGCATAVVLLGTAYLRYQWPGRVRTRTVRAYAVATGVLVTTLVVARWLPAPADLVAIVAGCLGYVVLAIVLGLVRPAEIGRVRVVLGRATLPVRRASGRLAGRGGRRLLILGCLSVPVAAMLWNIWASPDSQYDEVVYTRAAQRVAQGWQLTWTEQPMFVHPPLSFLTQASWLELLGKGSAPLADAITAARVLAGLASVAAILVLAALVHRLTPQAAPRRRNVLVFAVVLLAATDTILLRYGRLAIIEPFALLGSLATLYLSLVLWRRSAAWYVGVVGLVTGLTLLTKEVSLFLLVTPAVFALLGHDWRGLRRTVGALLTGIALWLLFPLWAMQLGLAPAFFDVKFATLQRLLGFIQITGWNRSDASFLSAVAGQAGQYASSYLLLAGGALALVWLLLHRVSESARWLLAWLLASYAFGGYAVLLGTLNEQFFVYVMPAALAGTVLVADAVVAQRTAARTTSRASVAGAPAAAPHSPRRRGARLLAAAVILPMLALFGFAASSWARFYLPANDAILRATAFIRENLPACSAVNATGDPDKFGYLLPGYPVTTYGTGAGASSNGVHLFFLSDKDAALGYGNSNPRLNSWVRANGTRLATFPSATYQGLELWRTPPDRYDPLTDVTPVPGGSFVVTEGSRCGGYRVVNGATGGFASGWTNVGGKALSGAPLTASWTSGGRTYQMFDGVVLVADGDRRTAALPIVEELAAAAPGAYRAAQLPPPGQRSAARPPSDFKVLSLLTDPAIAATYLGTGSAGSARSATPADVDRARALFGDPLGSPVRMPDGHIRQPFAGTVLEHAPGSSRVRAAPVGRLARSAGLLTPTARSGVPEPPPPLAPDIGPREPATVVPFVRSLGAALAAYVAVLATVLAVRPRRRRPAETAEAAA